MRDLFFSVILSYLFQEMAEKTMIEYNRAGRFAPSYFSLVAADAHFFDISAARYCACPGLLSVRSS